MLSIESSSIPLFYDLMQQKIALQEKKFLFQRLFLDHSYKVETYNITEHLLGRIDPHLINLPRTTSSNYVIKIALDIYYVISQVIFGFIYDISKLVHFYQGYNFVDIQLHLLKQSIDHHSESYKIKLKETIDIINAHQIKQVSLLSPFSQRIWQEIPKDIYGFFSGLFKTLPQESDKRAEDTSAFKAEEALSEIDLSPKEVPSPSFHLQSVLIAFLKDEEFTKFFIENFFPPITHFSEKRIGEMLELEMRFDKAYNKQVLLGGQSANIAMASIINVKAYPQTFNLSFIKNQLLVKSSYGDFSVTEVLIKTGSLTLKLKKDWIPEQSVQLTFVEFKKAFETAIFT